ncbi:hypothetical protein PHLGIDRAFT_76121, partial [Phlebiopsis gigantea 11061_1 CR5-6]
IGVCLAIGSGILIGSSFVFKKKGLLSSQEGHAAGEGVAYLKSPMWWTGMIIMILGELCNFAAYAFVEAIIVTPMGALSVVISSLLSHFLLGEKLSLFGWIASIQCLIGSSILALNGPEEQSVNTVIGFRKLFVTPWFLTYVGVVIAVAVVLAVWAAPKYGKKSMLPYIGICSLIGGISVSCTQGLGACILTSIRAALVRLYPGPKPDPILQFKNWFIYFLMILVVTTLLTEIYYLNVALAMYNTGNDVYSQQYLVTPTYYVLFTFCTLVTSVILYQGLKASATQIITVVLAFFVICTGIFILQMSKVDPRKLEKACDMDDLDPSFDSDAQSTREIVEKTEVPGIDSLRGTFGAIGTIIRTKRRMRALSAASQASQASASRPSAEARGSANGRPGWLSGHWSTPRGSRFQPMHEGEDLEKGRVQMVEASNEKGSLEMPALPTPIALSRTTSFPGQPTSSTIPLQLLHTAASEEFVDDSISVDGSTVSNGKSLDLSRLA